MKVRSHTMFNSVLLLNTRFSDRGLGILGQMASWKRRVFRPHRNCPLDVEANADRKTVADDRGCNKKVPFVEFRGISQHSHAGHRVLQSGDPHGR